MPLFLIFWPLIFAIPSAAFRVKIRNMRSSLPIFACFVEFAVALYVSYLYGTGTDFYIKLPEICGLGLTFTLDGFRSSWIVIISFCWAMSEALAKEYLEEHQRRYHMFTLFTLAGTMGVFLSADLYTTFVFFELMSLASWAWVAHEENEKAQYASDTYLAVAVIGGLVTLMGLFILSYLTNGNLEIATLYENCKGIFGGPDTGLLIASGILLLLGFGAKAGMFPLHFWLPMAHPVAPAPASALLSGVLTKCGVFGIIVTSCEIFRNDVSWGKLVVGLGAVNMLWGAILGVFSVDLKRTLACSSVSQIGFILTGIGMCCILGEENALASRGVMLHMLNHSMIKLTLFLLAGIVAMNRHTLDLNRLRGSCKGNKLLMFAFLMGGLSVAGIPGFSGYISKTLLHEAIVEGTEVMRIIGENAVALKVIEWVFLVSGGLTLAYISKLFYTLFILPPSENQQPLKMNPLSALAVTLPACLMPILGLTPNITMDRIAETAKGFFNGAELHESINYFSLKNLSGAAISISIGVIVFFVIVKGVLTVKDKNGETAHKDVWAEWLDLEKSVLRPLVQRGLPTVFGAAFRLLDYLPDAIILFLRKTILSDRRPEPTPISSIEALDRTGQVLDNASRRLGKRIGKPSFVYMFAEKQQSVALTGRLICASMSFGLLLFCAGLTLTLVYLLL